MRSQSATITITRAVTVATGVFAPGHLGELTQYLPFELVDDILAQTKTVQRRLRDLPSRVGVYFLLALGMYPRLGYGRVWAKLTAGLHGLPVPCPSEKALRDLRRRLGPAPLKALRTHPRDHREPGWTLDCAADPPHQAAAIASTTVSATRWRRSQLRLTRKLKITNAVFIAFWCGLTAMTRFFRRDARPWLAGT